MSKQTQRSWWEPILPSTKAKADAVTAGVLKAGHIIPMLFGYNTTPDHQDRRCVDFMHYGDQAMRKAIEDYVIANAAALGVNGVISNHGGKDDDHPVRAGWPNDGEGGHHYHGPAGKWEPYYGANHHKDHVHVEFNADPIGHLAGQHASKPAGYPMPTSGEVYLDKLRKGQTDSDSVYYWQMAMNAITFVGGSELKLTGDYDAALVHETKLFQAQKCRDPQDGWPGPKQAQLAFRLAKAELVRKGVHKLWIYRDSEQAGGLIRKVW